jgi:acetyl esterase/lipase
MRSDVRRDIASPPSIRFPAAPDDAYAAFEWAVSHAGDFGADGGRVATIGTSAGANLAAAICLRAVDAPGPRPVFQVLVYPPLDATFQSQSFVDKRDRLLPDRRPDALVLVEVRGAGIA